MTMRWDTEYFTALEHRDLQANTIAINSSGNYVLLAGRRYIAIRNLDDLDNDTLRKFPMQSKYDVGSAEWNPTDFNSELCVISSNQRLEVYTWSIMGELTLTNSLKAHTRVITDLNWHRSDPNLLASCSVDTFIHVWDLRDPRRPALSLSAIGSEASQVRWNPLNGCVLATAHDGDVKLWDQRRGNAPVQYIGAHLAKIHGIDWNPTNERQLATCSQDNTVKFFDVENARRPSFVLTTSAPVWRARYTPFGTGLVTVVVPQLRRGENSLLLWNCRAAYSGTPLDSSGRPITITSSTPPVHNFVGHRDVVLEFAWRHRSNSDGYQLVTWSKDQSLLIWHMDSRLLELCGCENMMSCPMSDEDEDIMGHDVVDDMLSFYDKNQTNYHDVSNGDSLSDNDRNTSIDGKDARSTLLNEFSRLQTNLMQMHVVSMDTDRRMCAVQARSGHFLITVQVSFPNEYPIGVCPTFHLILDEIPMKIPIDASSLRSHLLQTLAIVAQQRVARNRTCLDQCLRQLHATMDHLSNADAIDGGLLAPKTRKSSYSSASITDPLLPANGNCQQSALIDVCVPFPRTCGASWCSSGLLVCFGRTEYANRLSRNRSNAQTTSTTPRSMADLVQIIGGDETKLNGVSAVWHFYNRQRYKGVPVLMKDRLVSPIQIYDASNLSPINKSLGEAYRLDGDVALVCRWNAQEAEKVGRLDLVQAWRLAELVAGPQLAEEEEDCQWTCRHPFGIAMIYSLISHYANNQDIQMAAMLACLFGKENDAGTLRKQSLKTYQSAGIGSPYHTIPPADIVSEGWLPLLRSARSSSLDNLRLDDNVAIAVQPGMFTTGCPVNVTMPITPQVLLPESTTIVTAVAAMESGNSCDDVDDLRSSATCAHFDYYKHAYAEVLHKWKLLYNRSEVLKYISRASTHHNGVQFMVDCQYCGKRTGNSTAVMGHPTHFNLSACLACRRPALRCIVCRLPVRGSANSCLQCGHGGHTIHLERWFRTHDQCPTGCGCRCLSQTADILY